MENRGPDGSNDTGLKFVSRPGTEPIECQTHTQNTCIIFINMQYINILNGNKKDVFRLDFYFLNVITFITTNSKNN